jgi:hypothetical protein
LVLEATPNGLGEVSDDRLVLAPVVRQELLTGSKNVVVEPVKRIALGYPSNKGTGTHVLDHMITRTR